jgi:AhpD family alkylhydroperoxidase
MIAVVVSMANGCLYCLVAHGAALRETWGDPVMADRITLDWRRADGLTERQRAICAVAEKLTRNPLECAESDLDALRAHGLSDDDAWDVVEVAAIDGDRILGRRSAQLPGGGTLHAALALGGVQRRPRPQDRDHQCHDAEDPDDG